MTRSVLVISKTKETGYSIARDMKRFIGAFASVETFCLEERADLSGLYRHDIFVVANQTVMDAVRAYLPAGRPVFLAARTINIENLHKLIELEPGSSAIVIGTSEETADITIKIIEGLGIQDLDLAPYYPGCPRPCGDIGLAITPGLFNLVPEGIETVIDLGIQGLDLSTYAELLSALSAPASVLNDITRRYIRAILKPTIQSKAIARKNAALKRELELVLDTVSEAIMFVNRDHTVMFINAAAERLFQIFDAVGRRIDEIFPDTAFPDWFESGESVFSEIVPIGQTNFVVTANLNIDEKGESTGAVVTFRQVSEIQELENKVRRALRHKGNVAKRTFRDVIGHSEELLRMIDLARRFARTELTILIQGESGTGKELIAQAIHNESGRSSGPFVALNFAALPESLVESELFGYEEGAFTGAKKGGKPGLFEEAHNGTIFLDEIGDAPLETQKRLLRVLEEREVRRVGGNVTTPVNVRVIAATNQNLWALVEQEKFRKDLYFRLCAVPISIPALRERSGDIEELVRFFVSRQYHRRLNLSDELKSFLTRYSWPGNIRELENMISFLCTAVAPGRTAELSDLPTALIKNHRQDNGAEPEKAHQRAVRQESPYQAILEELIREGSAGAIEAILGELYRAVALNKGLGRNELQTRLKSRGVDASENQVRRWLSLLRELGLIEVGTARQGSRINTKGEEFWRYMKEKGGLG